MQKPNPFAKPSKDKAPKGACKTPMSKDKKPAMPAFMKKK